MKKLQANVVLERTDLRIIVVHAVTIEWQDERGNRVGSGTASHRRTGGQLGHSADAPAWAWAWVEAQPQAVVVRASQALVALDCNGQPAALDELLEKVPGLAELVNSEAL